MTTQSADTPRAESITLVPEFEGQHMYSVCTTAASIQEEMQLISHRSQFFYGEVHSPDIHPSSFLPSGSTVVRHYLGNKLYCPAVAMRVISVACGCMTEHICLPCNSSSKIVFDHVCISACMQSFVRSHAVRAYQNMMCLLQQACDVHQQICTSKSAAHNQPTEDCNA